MSSRCDGPNTGPSPAARCPLGRTIVGAGDDHRAGPAVVADRQVLPVRQQRRLVRAGRSGRRWWRGARRSRSRRSRRPRTAGAVRPSASGTQQRLDRRGAASVSSSTIRRRTARPVRTAQRHERVEGAAAQRAAGEDQPGRSPRRAGRARGRRPVRRSAAARPPWTNTPYGRVLRVERRSSIRSNPPVRRRPSRIRSVSGSSTLHEPKPTHSGRSASRRGPGRLDQRHRVGGGEQLGHLGDLGAVDRRGGGRPAR